MEYSTVVAFPGTVLTWQQWALALLSGVQYSRVLILWYVQSKSDACHCRTTGLLVLWSKEKQEHQVDFPSTKSAIGANLQRIAVICNAGNVVTSVLPQSTTFATREVLAGEGGHSWSLSSYQCTGWTVSSESLHVIPCWSQYSPILARGEQEDCRAFDEAMTILVVHHVSAQSGRFNGTRRQLTLKNQQRTGVT